VMLALIKTDDVIDTKAESDWIFSLDAGLYASSLCIVFALTAAPVGQVSVVFCAQCLPSHNSQLTHTFQPTQIILAHIWNALIGLAFQNIPSGETNVEDFFDLAETEREYRQGLVLPVAWKQAMSVAFGVSGMALLGIMHPPASGLAFSFAFNSSELLLWDELHLRQYHLISSCSCTFLIITDLSINDILIILLGGETKTCTNLLFSLIQQENVVTYIHTILFRRPPDVIMIGMAVIILNLSPFKQYPVSSYYYQTIQKEAPNNITAYLTF